MRLVEEIALSAKCPIYYLFALCASHITITSGCDGS